jgi:hypothetical protein
MLWCFSGRLGESLKAFILGRMASMVLGNGSSRSVTTALDRQSKEQTAPALDSRVGIHTQEDLAAQPISSTQFS